jgi:hypothetical protein
VRTRTNQRRWSKLTARLAALSATLAYTETNAQSVRFADLPPADRSFLEDVERRTFRFFWETTDATTGLTPTRWPSAPSSSIAGVGFALTGYCIGAERGYVSRREACERVDVTLRTLSELPQSEEEANAGGCRGFFYHFLDASSGLRHRGCELSSMDTALLMAGILSSGLYFDQDDEIERRIRRLADDLYCRVEWNWMQPRAPLMGMAWRPGDGFDGHDYRGYNETMILYVLALGSPTHPISPEAWRAYVGTYEWGECFGQRLVNFSPLFGHYYSHAWIDFRDVQDDAMAELGVDYFENSRRAAYSQRAYAVANPGRWRDYGGTCWGLTACDGPVNRTVVSEGRTSVHRTYWARGVSARGVRDDGTLAPSAAASALPFAPEISLPTIRHLSRRYGDNLYSEYGFLDSFNPSFRRKDVALSHGRVVDDLGWFDDEYLASNQGPILLMLENFRSEFVWTLMKRSPYVRRGLAKAGFAGGWLDRTS